MSQDVLKSDEPLLTVPDVAEKMGVVVTKVHHLIRDHQILVVKRDGITLVPARFFNEDGSLNRFVPGCIALLSDGHFTDAEILSYLFSEDDSLPGRPIDALHGHLAREVMRRAQAMAL